MFFNNFNHLNYHLTYRNLFNISKLKSTNLLFLNKTSNLRSYADNLKEEKVDFSSEESQSKKKLEESNLNNQQKNEYLTSQLRPDKKTLKSSVENLTSYLQMIRNCKKNAENTYLLIFWERKNGIKLPTELNSKRYQYFNLRNKDMCLIDFECGKEIVDKIFQNNDEEKIGNSKFYHVKGPFLSSRLIVNNDRNSEEIKFQSFEKTKIDFNELKVFKNVEQQLDFLTSKTEVSDLEKRIKFTLINYLERCICKGVFENFELIPFGSSFTGLGCGFSDLDLILMPKPLNLNQNSKELNEFIDKNGLTYLYKHKPLDKKLVNSCLSIIKNQLNLLPGMEPQIHITGASVPIIKLSCPIVNIEMDISMVLKAYENSGILMSQTLYSFCKLFPNLRKLYVVLRLWAIHQNVVTPDQPSVNLKNFTLLMLIISFLQNRQLLPPMQSIFADNSLNQFLNNNQNVNFVELISEFFDYIILTDFSRNSIDLYHAKMSRNLSQQPMFIKNPYDNEFPNIARNLIRRSILRLKTVAKASKQKFDKDDLSSLFIVDTVKVPDIEF